jgi:hypothetical protein
MVSRKVQNSRILIGKLLKLILFYLTIPLKLGFLAAISLGALMVCQFLNLTS